MEKVQQGSPEAAGEVNGELFNGYSFTTGGQRSSGNSNKDDTMHVLMLPNCVHKHNESAKLHCEHFITKMNVSE